MVAVKTLNLSKKYVLYPNPKYLFKEFFDSGEKVAFDEKWAIKDLNISVPQGQTCAFIGRNGSGKSTLLGLISGIILPTSGNVKTDGRISTILELGSGLQPELTGKHNISLFGSYLGLAKNETDRHLEDIIEFSELGKDIDKPVRTYSTGMLMRLGFSVGVHMEFDILLLDEILSVGDLLFRRKCVSKIRQFKEMGKTILLASHSLGDVSSISDRVILLDNGQIVMDGLTESVIKRYWEECEKDQNRINRKYQIIKENSIYGDDTGEIKITHVHFLNKDGEKTDTFETNQELIIRIGYYANIEVQNPLFRVQFFRNDGLWVQGSNTYRQGLSLGTLKGKGMIQLRYERLNLLAADYFVSVGIWPDEYKSFITDVAYDYHEMSYIIHVKSTRRDGAGIVYSPFKWDLIES